MARNDAEILKEAKKVQAEKIELQKKSIALTKEEQKQLESLISKQKELRKEIQELRQEKLDALKGEESSIKSMGSMYGNLNDLQKEGLSIAAKNTGSINDQTKLSKEQIGSISKIQEINRSISQLGVDDVEGRKALTNEYNTQMKSLDGRKSSQKDIKRNLKEQNSLAQDYANMSSEQKDLIQSQHDVLEGVKKTIQGTLMTVKTLYGNIQGAVGGLISGLGVVVGKIGEANTELGTSMFQTDGIARKAGVLSLVFGDAVSNAKDLSAMLGDTNKATFELQASVGLMSTNMGISGGEATKLVGAFSRLNGNSTDVALDMSKTSQEFAKQNGIIPAQLMGDLANSAEEFALFGKDGGTNILRAAGYAAKLGTSMATLSGISEGLLDFETSVTKELELGAMLGKNINLNKARELAYSGDIEGATKETLKQLGGIDAFNKMDYYQKKQTADLLGVSVAELQKMNSKMENAGSLGNVISENFSVAGEALDAGLNKYLGTSLKGLGGMVTAGAQVGANFKMLGLDMGGMVGSLKNGLKHLIMYPIYLAKAAAIKIGKAVGIGDGVVGKYGGSIASKGKDAIKDKGKDLLKDKITDVEVPDAPAVASGPSMGDKLKDLAGGLKEMGNAKVLFGALNLIPTGLGFLFLTPGIPGMMGTAAYGGKAGTGLVQLGLGLTAMGTGTVSMGALNLVLAGLGFLLMTPGLVGMAGVALLGVATGTGLTALAGGLLLMGGASTGATALLLTAAAFIAMIPGSIGMMAFALAVPFVTTAIGILIPALTALGTAMLTGVAALGLAALIAAGVGLGISFALIGAGAMMMGKGIQFIAQGFATLLPALGTFMSSITLEQVGLVGLFAFSLIGLAGSLIVLSIASLFALPALMGLAYIIPLLGLGFGLLGNAISVIGTVLDKIPPIIAAVASGMVSMLGAITLEKALAIGVLAYSFVGLAGSLFALSIASLFALPALMGLAFVTTLLGVGLGILGTALATMSQSMGTFATGLSSVLEVITLEKAAAIASLALAFIGLAGSLVLLGISGLVAVPVMMGIGFATMLLGVAFNVLGTGMQAVGLGLSTIMTSLGGLVAIIGPITMLSLALLGLSGALMGLGLSMAFLGLAGLPGLLVLGGISAMAEPIIKLASFFGLGGTAEAGGSEETGALEAGSMSEYETNMLSKMDQLIQATTSQRDIYLDRDKVTNVVMDRGERSSVNKFKLNKA